MSRFLRRCLNRGGKGGGRHINECKKIKILSHFWRMRNEDQNIEYKEAWRDEYLKWICGFANAQGGRIYIGIDDDRNIIGLSDSKRFGRHSQQSR